VALAENAYLKRFVATAPADHGNIWVVRRSLYAASVLQLDNNYLSDKILNLLFICLFRHVMFMYRFIFGWKLVIIQTIDGLWRSLPERSRPMPCQSAQRGPANSATCEHG